MSSCPGKAAREFPFNFRFFNGGPSGGLQRRQHVLGARNRCDRAVARRRQGGGDIGVAACGFEIVTRGFNPGDDGLMAGAKRMLEDTLAHSSEEEKADYGVIKEKIRADLKRYMSRQTQKRPLIMPVILEI